MFVLEVSMLTRFIATCIAIFLLFDGAMHIVALGFIGIPSSFISILSSIALAYSTFWKIKYLNSSLILITAFFSARFLNFLFFDYSIFGVAKCITIIFFSLSVVFMHQNYGDKCDNS